ncbi:ATP-binding protein [Streptomyces sp. NPDC002586]
MLCELTSVVLPQAGAMAASGRSVEAELVVPDALRGTTLAVRTQELAARIAAIVDEVQAGAQLAAQRHVSDVRTQAGEAIAAAQSEAAQEIARIRSSAEGEVAEARRTSEEATRAVLRSLTNGLVVKASVLKGKIGEAVRRHEDADAYESFVNLDHLARQLLLTAQGYGILAGDKLSRRYPATSVTEVIRAAMGYVDGYTRVVHQDQDVAIQGRAVEAVINTLAVLMDNALRYSPPTASVYVSVEQGHHACLIHVDDAGIRMGDETLLWASSIMSGEQDVDVTQLGADPKVGLRVVSLLAKRYGFRVDLVAPNRYEGTRATVVLPKELVTQLATRDPKRAPAAIAEGGDASAPRESSTAAATTASGLAVRRRGPAHRTEPVRTEPARSATPGIAADWAAGSRDARKVTELTDAREGH